MENKKVATIVVTYNRFLLLQECVNSLREQTYSNQSIIIVNNGSTDETPEWLSNQHDLITINQENVGGAGGFFTGIKFACENGYDYSWIMDDDVVADKDALASLMKKADLVPGFLCSRVIDNRGEMCNIPRLTKNKSEISGEFLWGDKIEERLLRVDIATFVSVLIPSSVIFELGLPIKEYFIWGDDVEYTKRISFSYPSYLDLDSVVIHKRIIQKVLSIRTEANPKRVKFYYYMYRNRIHNQNEIIKKCGLFILGILESFWLMVNMKFPKSIIVLRGTWASLFFSPKIHFPQK